LQKKYFNVLIIVLLAGIAIYALAGFLVAPRMLTNWVETSIATEPGSRLTVEGAYVNPFTLFLSLTNVTLINDKNKAIISVAGIRSHFWSIEKFRSKRPGHDAEIRELQVNNPSTADKVLTAPYLSATGLVVNAANGKITVGTARLETPEFRVVRDGEGNLQLPAWLPLPQNDSPAATVVFDTLDVSGGQIRLTDHAHSPAVRLEAGDIVANVTRGRVAGATTVTVEFAGRVGESGSAEVGADWRPGDWRAPTTVDLALRHIDLPVVSPYFEQIAGRGIAAGIGDLTLHYERRDSNVRIDHRFGIDGFQLDEDVSTDTDTELPLDLAVALLADEGNRIDFSIPTLQAGVAAGFDPLRIIVAGVRDYVTDLATTPFDSLASLVGSNDEDLGSFTFLPASADITAATAEKISLLARALELRPLLGLRTRPAYHPVADRDAIAAEQVRLHVRLATSASPPGSATHKPLDFDDAKVRAILDEFAGARLSQAQRNAISNRFRDNDADYYRSVYDALVANENVSETVLRRLARFRARSIAGALADKGIDSERLLLADEIDAVVLGPDEIVVRLEVICAQ
jgi:hypothetical protein